MSRAPTWARCSAASSGRPRRRRSIARPSGEQGKFAEAAAAYADAIRLRPDDAKAHLGLGLAFERQRMLREALAAYGAAVRLRPDDANLHQRLGLALRRRRRYADAPAALREAIRL